MIAAAAQRTCFLFTKVSSFKIGRQSASSTMSGPRVTYFSRSALTAARSASASDRLFPLSGGAVGDFRFCYIICDIGRYGAARTAAPRSGHTAAQAKYADESHDQDSYLFHLYAPLLKAHSEPIPMRCDLLYALAVISVLFFPAPASPILHKVQLCALEPNRMVIL